MEKFLSDITYSKQSRQINVIISLFYACNQNCKFCNQLQYNRRDCSISESFILSCINKLYQMFIAQAKFSTFDKLNIIFEGGQIFSDIHIHQLYQLLETIKKHIDVCFLNKQIEIKFISSGIFLNRENVLDILNLFNAKLILSYDPSDRFLIKAQKKTFINTLQFFAKHNKIDSFNTILTKPNIDAYINNDSEIVNLCKSYNLTINLLYYIPNQNYKLFLPTQQDLYNFYKFAIKSNWQKICPQIYNIMRGIKNYKNGVEITERYCKCLNTYRINSHLQNYTMDCINCLSNEINYKLENISNNIAENIILNGQKKYKCNSCKYKMNCIMPCWNLLNNNLVDTKQCPLYKIIQEQLNA